VARDVEGRTAPCKSLPYRTTKLPLHTTQSTQGRSPCTASCCFRLPSCIRSIGVDWAGRYAAYSWLIKVAGWHCNPCIVKWGYQSKHEERCYKQRPAAARDGSIAGSGTGSTVGCGIGRAAWLWGLWSIGRWMRSKHTRAFQEQIVICVQHHASVLNPSSHHSVQLPTVESETLRTAAA